MKKNCARSEEMDGRARRQRSATTKKLTKFLIIVYKKCKLFSISLRYETIT